MRPSGTPAHARARARTHALHAGELHKEIPDNPNYQHVNKWTLNPKVRTHTHACNRARTHTTERTITHTHSHARAHTQNCARTHTHAHTHTHPRTLRRSR